MLQKCYHTHFLYQFYLHSVQKVLQQLCHLTTFHMDYNQYKKLLQKVIFALVNIDSFLHIVILYFLIFFKCLFQFQGRIVKFNVTLLTTFVACQLFQLFFGVKDLLSFLFLYLKNLNNFFFSKLRFSLSKLSISFYSIHLSIFVASTLRAILFFISHFSFSFNLSNFNLYALNLSNNVVIFIIVKSLQLEIIITFGRHDLFKFFIILILIFFLTKVFLKVKK